MKSSIPNFFIRPKQDALAIDFMPWRVCATAGDYRDGTQLAPSQEVQK
jgi:hypothetical protein